MALSLFGSVFGSKKSVTIDEEVSEISTPKIAEELSEFDLAPQDDNQEEETQPPAMIPAVPVVVEAAAEMKPAETKEDETKEQVEETEDKKEKEV